MMLWVFLAIFVGMLAVIRLAPSDPDRWHVAPNVSEDKDFPGGIKRKITTGPDGLDRLNAAALATARTSVLAGSVETGMITYVTRSKLIGFPDYTTVQQTVQQDGDVLEIYGRLRFGRSDFGVNRARVQAWVDTLQP